MAAPLAGTTTFEPPVEITPKDVPHDFGKHAVTRLVNWDADGDGDVLIGAGDGKDEFGYAVRGGDFKLVSSIYKGRKLLFNIEADPYEQHDLAAAHPEIVQRLTAAYERWAKEMKPPLWLDPHGANVRSEEAGRQRAVENASRGEREP